MKAFPLWAVTLIGSLVITILAFIMILTVYGRFFKIYLYTAIAPIPLATFGRAAHGADREELSQKLCGSMS